MADTSVEKTTSVDVVEESCDASSNVEFSKLYAATRSKYTIPDVGVVDAKDGSISNISVQSTGSGTAITFFQNGKIKCFIVDGEFILTPHHYNEIFKFNSFVEFVSTVISNSKEVDSNITFVGKFKTAVDVCLRKQLDIAAAPIGNDEMVASEILLADLIGELSSLAEQLFNYKNEDISKYMKSKSQDSDEELAALYEKFLTSEEFVHTDE